MKDKERAALHKAAFMLLDIEMEGFVEQHVRRITDGKSMVADGVAIVVLMKVSNQLDLIRDTTTDLTTEGHLGANAKDAVDKTLHTLESSIHALARALGSESPLLMDYIKDKLEKEENE